MSDLALDDTHIGTAHVKPLSAVKSRWIRLYFFGQSPANACLEGWVHDSGKPRLAQFSQC